MKRVLVAGIGNVFRGDDAFGVEVVRRLLEQPIPAGVRVADFGTRGHDLAYAILEGYDDVVFVDLTQRGGAPGTVYTLELDPDQHVPQTPSHAHGIELPAVFNLVRALGGDFPRLFLVGCEPADFGPADEGRMGLSEPVTAAVGQAVALVEAVVAGAAAEASRA